MTVGVVVLHWNTPEATGRCLQSVLEAEGVRVQGYVVDNGSTPMERNGLERRFPSFVFLGEGTNKGFALGANLGAQRALDDGCDAVFFLNSDATVRPDCLQRLASTGASIVVPRIVSSADHEIIWYDGGRISFRGKGLHPGMGRRVPAAGKRPDQEPVNFATACAMFVTRGVFAKVGFLDDAFFAYAEDLDFSLRAGDAGVKIVILRTALAYHDQSLSVRHNAGKPLRDYYVLRNQFRILKKHFRNDHYRTRLIAVLGVDWLARLVIFCLSGRFARALAVCRGAYDGVRGGTGRSPEYG